MIRCPTAWVGRSTRETFTAMRRTRLIAPRSQAPSTACPGGVLACSRRHHRQCPAHQRSIQCQETIRCPRQRAQRTSSSSSATICGPSSGLTGTASCTRHTSTSWRLQARCSTRPTCSIRSVPRVGILSWCAQTTGHCMFFILTRFTNSKSYAGTFDCRCCVDWSKTRRYKGLELLG